MQNTQSNTKLDEGVYMSRLKNSQLVKRGFKASSATLELTNHKTFIESIVACVVTGLHNWKAGSAWKFRAVNGSFVFIHHKTECKFHYNIFLQSIHGCFAESQYMKAIAQYMATSIVQFIIDNSNNLSKDQDDFTETTKQTISLAIKLMLARINNPFLSNPNDACEDIDTYFTNFVSNISTNTFHSSVMFKRNDGVLEISRHDKVYSVTTRLLDVDDARIVAACVLAALFDTNVHHGRTLLDRLPGLVHSYIGYRRTKTTQSQVKPSKPYPSIPSVSPTRCEDIVTTSRATSHYTTLTAETIQLIHDLNDEAEKHRLMELSSKLHVFDFCKSNEQTNLSLQTLENMLFESITNNDNVENDDRVLLACSSINADAFITVNRFLEQDSLRRCRLMVLHLTNDPDKIVWNPREDKSEFEVVNVVAMSEDGNLNLVSGCTQFHEDSIHFLLGCSHDVNHLRTTHVGDRSLSYKIMTYNSSKSPTWWQTAHRRSGFGCLCSRGELSWFSSSINTLIHTESIASLLRLSHIANDRSIHDKRGIHSLSTPDLDHASCEVIIDQLLVKRRRGYYEGSPSSLHNANIRHDAEKAYHTALQFLRQTCILGIHFNILNTTGKYTSNLINDISRPFEWTSLAYIESCEEGDDLVSHQAWHDHPHPLIIIMQISRLVKRYPPHKITVNHVSYTRKSACILIKGPTNLFCPGQNKESNHLTSASTHVVAGVSDPGEAVIDCYAVIGSGKQEWDLKGVNDRTLFRKKVTPSADTTTKTVTLRQYSLERDLLVYQKIRGFSYMVYAIDSQDG